MVDSTILIFPYLLAPIFSCNIALGWKCNLNGESHSFVDPLVTHERANREL